MGIKVSSKANGFNSSPILKIKNYRCCPVADICRYCNFKMAKRCCLYREIQFLKLIKCFSYKCVNSKDCIEMICDCLFNIEKRIHINDIPTIEEILSNSYVVKRPLIKLNQHFIPRIDINSKNISKRQVSLIGDLNFDILAVGLQDIISNNPNLLIKSNYLCDLHDLLQFKGKILLLTNMYDNFCEKILKANNLFKFIDLLKILNPDIITTFDANFYTVQPLFITLYQLNRILKANYYLNNLNIHQIALVPPIPLFLFKKVCKLMIGLGYKTIGVPLQEINKNHEFKFRDYIVGILNQFKLKYDINFILISTHPYSKSHVDCFSSHTWVVKNTKSLSIDEKMPVWANNLKKSRRIAYDSFKQQTIIKYIQEVV